MKFILAIIGFLLSASAVFGGGLAVEPSRLDFNLAAGQTASSVLKIENIADQVMIYQLYFDELNEILSISEETFRLAPGERRQVKVSVTPRQSGIFATNLSVVGQELDRRAFNVSFGAKVPVNLRVASASGLSGNIANQAGWLALALIGAAGALYALFLKQRKSFWRRTINFLHRRPWWKRIF